MGGRGVNLNLYNVFKYTVFFGGYPLPWYYIGTFWYKVFKKLHNHLVIIHLWGFWRCITWEKTKCIKNEWLKNHQYHFAIPGRIGHFIGCLLTRIRKLKEISCRVSKKDPIKNKISFKYNLSTLIILITLGGGPQLDKSWVCYMCMFPYLSPRLHQLWLCENNGPYIWHSLVEKCIRIKRQRRFGGILISLPDFLFGINLLLNTEMI